MELTQIRKEIDRIDSEIVRLVAERMSYMPQVAAYKKQNGLPRKHPDREAELISAKRVMADELCVSADLIEDIFWRLIDEAHKEQKKILD